jgi:rhamnosyltransferase
MQQGIKEKFTQNIGIMAPFHLDKDTENTPAHAEDVKEVEVVMTSGNLLNLEAYAKVGPFKTDFFIDYIDYEYCLRLKSFGYKIFQARQAILQHHVGDITLNYLLGKRVTASNHSYLRRYYITRNRLAVMSLYKDQIPHYFYQELKDFSKDFLRIILFEKDKIKKLLHIAYGVRDFKAGKFGKYNSK